MNRSSSLVRIVLPAPAPRRSISYNYTPDHAQLELSDKDMLATGLRSRYLGFGYGAGVNGNAKDGKVAGRPATQEPEMRSADRRTLALGDIPNPEAFMRVLRDFDTAYCDSTGQTAPSCTTFVHRLVSRIVPLPFSRERLRPPALAAMIQEEFRLQKHVTIEDVANPYKGDERSGKRPADPATPPPPAP